MDSKDALKPKQLGDFITQPQRRRYELDVTSPNADFNFCPSLRIRRLSRSESDLNSLIQPPIKSDLSSSCVQLPQRSTDESSVLPMTYGLTSKSAVELVSSEVKTSPSLSARVDVGWQQQRPILARISRLLFGSQEKWHVEPLEIILISPSST